MRQISVIVTGLVMGLLTVGASPKRSNYMNARKAYDQRDKIQWSDPRLGAYKDLAMGVSDIRWDNFSKSIAKMPKLEEIVRISISKTSDTNEFVVSVEGVDGRVASFWCDLKDAPGSGSVRSITPY